jgi:arabinogalactan oligomer/maltooligosaccharide transport system substrate-binding protein
LKKFISFVIAAVLMMTMVTGCGSDKSKKETNENGEVTGKISVQAEKAWVPYYEQAIARVKEKYPKAEVEIVEIGVFDHLDILNSTDATNKDVADVFPFGLDGVGKLDKNDNLAEFDALSMAEELGYSDFESGLGSMLKIDDRYLAIPYNIETLIMFANKANAKTSGIDLSKNIEFTDLKAQDMLAILHNGWFGVAFTNSVYLDLLSQDDSGEFHSDLVKDYTSLVKEQQDLFEAMFNYWKQHNEAGTDLWDKNASNGYLDSAFMTGNGTSLRLDGPWATPSLSEKTDGGKDLEILPINSVTVNGDPLAHWQAGWALGINIRIQEDKNKMTIAQELIKQIVNPEHAVELFKATGKILPNVTAEKYQESDLEDMDKAVIEAVIKSYEKAVPRPVIPEWDNVWGTWENAILSWSAVKPENVEDAYKQVQASFKAMLDTLK